MTKAQRIGLNRKCHRSFNVFFLSRINKHSNIFGEDGKYPTECWQWIGHTNSNGYGVIDIFKKKFFAHRISYIKYVGAIPINLQLDHLCRNRKCVNPDHLEAVTQQTNLLRGKTVVAKQAKQTHCINNHEFNDVNTYRYKNKRYCKVCRKNRRDKK